MMERAHPDHRDYKIFPLIAWKISRLKDTQTPLQHYRELFQTAKGVKEEGTEANHENK
jgi:hypothetical protein